MIISIFGATGMVGRQLVIQALHNGHTVKAFGRNVFTTRFEEDKNLELVQGALFDADQVYKTLQGCDAVLSALGGAFDGSEKTRSLGMKNIVTQMEKAGVKRIIAVGGKGVLDSGEGDMIMESPLYPRQYIAVGVEHFKALEHLRSSSLDWTFVAPPDIIDAEATGIFQTAADILPVPNKDKINAGDLAMFMVNELTKNAFVRSRVGISN
ncbi:MAG: SDR family oxidoreductase [Ferruginibacter sp.]